MTMTGREEVKQEARPTYQNSHLSQLDEFEPMMMEIRVDSTFEAVEWLLDTYTPIFNAASKECMPPDFAPKRAKQLWRNASQVLTYKTFVDSTLVAGALLVEVTRENPPVFIPDTIFGQVLVIAGPERRLFYLTALFRTANGTHLNVKTLRQTILRDNPGCHFYATITAIRKKIFANEGEYIGFEDWLDERREYYCINS